MLFDDFKSGAENLMDAFTEEREVEYKGEHYFVRDNGAVCRRHQPRKRSRPLDKAWTFGRQSALTGYMYIAGVPVHRIVCSAFGGAPADPALVVDHIDTNRANNRPENLRWVSRLENVLLNPISSRRIELVYGSIEEFFNNPSKVQTDQHFPDITWMRTVSREEAAAARQRLEDWAKSGTLLRGGAIGPWLYHSTSTIIPPSRRKITESLTPSAAQVDWRVPTEFPYCPLQVNENGLEEYEAGLAFGKVFGENPYYQSLVVQHCIAGDGLVVLTHLPDNPIKHWAVAHVSVEDELYYHRSEATYFSLQGALKRYCELTGDSYDDPIDDYC
jgi:hypothetical protein